MFIGDRVNKLFGALFGLIFAGVGFGVTFFLGLPIVNTAKESINWPQTTGVITSSKVESHRGDDSTTYSSEVRYAYTVNDQELIGDVVYFGDDVSSSDSSIARTTVKQYPKGKEVKVFYDPEEPGNSALETGTTWSSYFMLIFGLVFLGVGLLVMFACAWPLIGGGLLLAGGILGFLGAKRNSNNDRSSPDDYPTGVGNRYDPTPRNQSSQWSLDEDDGFDI